jgi:hypothetical protein
VDTPPQRQPLYAYLDDSVSGDGKTFCSAGYLFEPQMADQFRKGWEPFLKSKGLPFFHATDDFRRPDAQQIFSKLANLTKATALRGCINFLTAETLAGVHKSIRGYIGSEFSVCTLGCMKLMADVAKEQNRLILYFIENQGEFGGELRTFLTQMKNRLQQSENYAMKDADLCDKKDVIQLQAADLFAWAFTRSQYRGGWIQTMKDLTQDRVLRHTMTSHDPTMVAMMNSFHGMRSNRRKFAVKNV